MSNSDILFWCIVPTAVWLFVSMVALLIVVLRMNATKRPKVMKLDALEVHAVRVLVSDHYVGCNDQTVSCLGCCVFIERFKDES